MLINHAKRYAIIFNILNAKCRISEKIIKINIGFVNSLLHPNTLSLKFYTGFNACNFHLMENK